MANITRLTLLAVSLASSQAAAQMPYPGDGEPPPTLMDRLHGLVDRGRERYADMQQRAMGRLSTVRHTDTCQQRRERLATVMPDALVLSQISEEVYAGKGDQMAARGVTEAVTPRGRMAYQGNGGNWYAEGVEFPAVHRVALVFRGTRTSSRGDLGTDLANFAGLETPYYAWAKDLAARIAATRPGWSLVTSGHSLGGGLALAAALSLSGSRAIVFDPAGLPARAWNAASPEARLRMTTDSSAFIATGSGAMDAISAGSVVGMSVIPARIYAVPVADDGNPVERHSIAALETGIRRAGATDSACAIDAGTVGLP